MPSVNSMDEKKRRKGEGTDGKISGGVPTPNPPPSPSYSPASRIRDFFVFKAMVKIQKIRYQQLIYQRGPENKINIAKCERSIGNSDNSIPAPKGNLLEKGGKI